MQKDSSNINSSAKQESSIKYYNLLANKFQLSRQKASFFFHFAVAHFLSLWIKTGNLLYFRTISLNNLLAALNNVRQEYSTPISIHQRNGIIYLDRQYFFSFVFFLCLVPFCLALLLKSAFCTAFAWLRFYLLIPRRLKNENITCLIFIFIPLSLLSDIDFMPCESRFYIIGVCNKKANIYYVFKDVVARVFVFFLFFFWIWCFYCDFLIHFYVFESVGFRLRSEFNHVSNKFLEQELKLAEWGRFIDFWSMKIWK